MIKKAKLRGAPSFGMICSERELGLTEDHSGIMVLPENAPAGARLVDVLDLDREVLDISITPNRADCLSVLGLAREAALAFNLPLTIPDLPLHLDADGPEAVVPIEIAAPELCWLYSGRVISEIKVAPSPMRVRHRLHAVGVRPISNIVDVTNYILFECGQPLHSFDLDKLRGGRIVVKPAREGEKFVTLDGQERVLTRSRSLHLRRGTARGPGRGHGRTEHGNYGSKPQRLSGKRGLSARYHPQDFAAAGTFFRSLLPFRARHRPATHGLGSGPGLCHDGGLRRRRGAAWPLHCGAPALCSGRASPFARPGPTPCWACG